MRCSSFFISKYIYLIFFFIYILWKFLLTHHPKNIYTWKKQKNKAPFDSKVKTIEKIINFGERLKNKLRYVVRCSSTNAHIYEYISCIILYFCRNFYFIIFQRKLFHWKCQKVWVNLIAWLNLFSNFSHKSIAIATIFHIIIKRNLTKHRSHHLLNLFFYFSYKSILFFIIFHLVIKRNFWIMRGNLFHFWVILCGYLSHIK